MNKEEIDEIKKIIQEPIVVNSINYKYFDEDNFNRIQYFVENTSEYIDFLEKSIKEINVIKEEYLNRINKAIEYINHAQNYGKEKNLYINGDDLLEILKGDSNE